MDDHTFDEKTAREWLATVERAGSSSREADLYPRLRAWVRRTSPRELVDIGCGEGSCAETLALAPGGRYTGVEPSPYLLDRARERRGAADRRFVEGSAYALPFADATFDAALSVMVWHLLSDPERAARELHRVLRPGGAFLIVTIHPDAHAEWKALYRDTSCDGPRFEGTLAIDGLPASRDVLHLHALEAVEGSLVAAGLDIGAKDPFRGGRYLAIEGTRSGSRHGRGRKILNESA